MALTKEDLDKIKLPLSDEDYRMLRREDAKSCYKIWQLASPELREAFNKKEAERKYDIPHKKGCLSRFFPPIFLQGDIELQGDIKAK